MRSFCIALGEADEIKAFFDPKNHKKQKDVRGMFQKTWRHRSKTIKKSEKRWKTFRFVVKGLFLGKQGVILEFFTPKEHSGCSNGYIGLPLGGIGTLREQIGIP